MCAHLHLHLGEIPITQLHVGEAQPPVVRHGHHVGAVVAYVCKALNGLGPHIITCMATCSPHVSHLSLCASSLHSKVQALMRMLRTTSRSCSVCVSCHCSNNWRIETIGDLSKQVRIIKHFDPRLRPGGQTFRIPDAQASTVHTWEEEVNGIEPLRIADANAIGVQACGEVEAEVLLPARAV